MLIIGSMLIFILKIVHLYMFDFYLILEGQSSMSQEFCVSCTIFKMHLLADIKSMEVM